MAVRRKFQAGSWCLNSRVKSNTPCFAVAEATVLPSQAGGDPNCATPPGKAFNAHGIDLVRRDDGRLQLLVVQHGSREAVELFEVIGSGADWRVEWRGCVPAPPEAWLNSVAGVSNGDFYTTQMTPLGLDLTQGIPSDITGHAFAWSQSKGSFRKIGGTDGAMPNGIVTSPDGRFIYMNATAEHSVRKVEVASGRELGRATVDSPDNARWAPDGRILIASLSRDITAQDLAACLSIERRACGIPFKIVALDPHSMTIVETLYANEGAPMGAGTVGLRVGDELFIGSFHGDRILRVNLATTNAEANWRSCWRSTATRQFGQQKNNGAVFCYTQQAARCDHEPSATACWRSPRRKAGFSWQCGRRDPCIVPAPAPTISTRFFP